LSLIKVDSLLARTYVGERRILGQAPRRNQRTGRPSDAVVAAWPELPQAIRAGIVAMVKAASK
jgi:hypothetical protein